MRLLSEVPSKTLAGLGVRCMSVSRPFSPPGRTPTLDVAPLPVQWKSCQSALEGDASWSHKWLSPPLRASPNLLCSQAIFFFLREALYLGNSHPDTHILMACTLNTAMHLIFYTSSNLYKAEHTQRTNKGLRSIIAGWVLEMRGKSGNGGPERETTTVRTPRCEAPC